MLKKLIKGVYSISSKRIRIFIEKFIKKIEKGEFWSTTLRELYVENYGIEIGIGTYGCFQQEKFKNISFGNYCSIAEGLEFFPRNHPKEFASTHPMFFNSDLGFIEKSPIEFAKLNIGHDVWIGKKVMITNGCKHIGNGAIIGCGSIVTKDVEPYTIVAGNPARIIGKRFEQKEIENLLEESRWYNLPMDRLKNYIKYSNDPKIFATKIINDNLREQK